jgi:hypothetical protein
MRDYESIVDLFNRRSTEVEGKLVDEHYMMCIPTDESEVRVVPRIDLCNLPDLDDDRLYNMLANIYEDGIKAKEQILGQVNAINKETILEKAFVELVDKECFKGTAYMQYVDKLDMYKVYRMPISRSGSLLLTEDLLDKYEIDVDELDEAAMKNAEKRFDELLIDNLFGNECMKIIATHDISYSSGLLLFPEKFEQVYDTDMYIIPSSRHEFLCVQNDSANIDELLAMIYEVNSCRDIIKEKDVLSNKLFTYSHEYKQIGICLKAS